MSSSNWLVQLPLGLQLREGLSFDTFHPGPNGELTAVLQGLATAPGSAGVFFFGPPGSGKSHLLQALCRTAACGGARAAYLPLAELAALGPTAIEGMAAFDLLCLDDFQGIAGDLEWERVLVSLWDRLRHRGGRLAVAASAAAERLTLRLPDLRSRLKWEPAYALSGLSDDDRLAVLRLRAHVRGLRLDDSTARYLLLRCNRELPALIRLLDRLDHASLAAQRRLTVPFVREVLADR